MTHDETHAPHDLAPELDDLSVAYAQLQAENAALRDQAAKAEADNARLFAILRAVDSTVSRPKHIERLFAEVRAAEHPGAALLAELDAARALADSVQAYFNQRGVEHALRPENEDILAMGDALAEFGMLEQARKAK